MFGKMASTSSPELPQVPAEISQDCERLLGSLISFASKQWNTESGSRKR